MERQTIFEKLNEIFIDVLDLDEVELTDATNANDIEEWDSESYTADCGYREKFRYQIHLTRNNEVEERRRDGKQHRGENRIVNGLQFL